MKNQNLKTYKVDYRVQFTVEPNPYTRVTIETERFENIICEQKDIEEISDIKFDVPPVFQLQDKVMYEKVIRDISIFNTEEFHKTVDIKLIDKKINEVVQTTKNYQIKNISFVESELNEDTDNEEFSNVMIKQEIE